KPLTAARRRSPHGGGGHSVHMEGAGPPPTWRGRALSPHGGGRHSAHMEGADTHAAFEYSLRTDSDLGSDATPVHIEGAATQFTLRTGQTACAASDPVSDLKLPEIRVCPPELVMPKTCK
ncbi:unnamed protein product, partial [Gadus morhua 'NCC']